MSIKHIDEKFKDNCYPGVVQTDETCWRFTDKSNQEQERVLFDNWWRESINQFGVKAKYYVNTFNVLSADNIYGEQPNKTFATPVDFVMGVSLNENAINLSKFGFMSEDEITAFIHIESFSSTFAPVLSNVFNTQNSLVEPKAGDVFQLSEYGNTRPGNRQAKYFEITERLDEDIAQINPLAGHYVFLIKAKRFDYSFEPGIPFTLMVGATMEVVDKPGETFLSDINVTGTYTYQGNGYWQCSNSINPAITLQEGTGGQGVHDYIWEPAGTDSNPTNITCQSFGDNDPALNSPWLANWNDVTYNGVTFEVTKDNFIFDTHTGNQQIYEGSFAGRLANGDNPRTEQKKPDGYDGEGARDGYKDFDIDKVSKEDIFDMSKNDTDVYGDYY
jgi:hypothetical protein